MGKSLAEATVSGVSKQILVKEASQARKRARFWARKRASFSCDLWHAKKCTEWSQKSRSAGQPFDVRSCRSLGSKARPLSGQAFRASLSKSYSRRHHRHEHAPRSWARKRARFWSSCVQNTRRVVLQTCSRWCAGRLVPFLGPLTATWRALARRTETRPSGAAWARPARL